MYKDKEYLYNQYIVNRLPVKVIAEKCNVSSSTIESWLRKFNIKRGDNNKHTLNEYKVQNDMSPILSYYAGLVATDGHFSKGGNRVALRVRNNGSYKVLSLIKDYLEYTGDIYVYNDVDNELSISNKVLRETLLDYGMSEDGKSKHFFPFIIKHLPPAEEHTRMFYRGVVDGDGNIRKNGVFRITMGNKRFMESFATSINNNLNIGVKVVPDRSYWKIEMTKKQSKIFLDFVYKGYDDFRFPDKYDNYKRGWRYSPNLWDSKP